LTREPIQQQQQNQNKGGWGVGAYPVSQPSIFAEHDAGTQRLHQQQHLNSDSSSGDANQLRNIGRCEPCITD